MPDLRRRLRRDRRDERAQSDHRQRGGYTITWLIIGTVLVLSLAIAHILVPLRRTWASCIDCATWHSVSMIGPLKLGERIEPGEATAWIESIMGPCHTHRFTHMGHADSAWGIGVPSGCSLSANASLIGILRQAYTWSVFAPDDPRPADLLRRYRALNEAERRAARRAFMDEISDGSTDERFTPPASPAVSEQVSSPVPQ